MPSGICNDCGRILGTANTTNTCLPFCQIRLRLREGEKRKTSVRLATRVLGQPQPFWCCPFLLIRFCAFIGWNINPGIRAKSHVIHFRCPLLPQIVQTKRKTLDLKTVSFAQGGLVEPATVVKVKAPLNGRVCGWACLGSYDPALVLETPIGL